MRPLDIKGVRIGAGRPRTVVSLMGATHERLLEEARNAVEVGAECVEWRADCLADLSDIATLTELSWALARALPSTPLIFTLRSVSQGGRGMLDVAAIADVVMRLIEEGSVDLIDLETCWGDEMVRSLAGRAASRGVRTIVSEHVLSGTPPTPWMVDRLAHCASLGADVCKLAVTARCHEDCLRLMEATALASDMVDLPLVTMAMGASGVLSRLAGEAFGSALTFCALGERSAPGQVELDVARRALDALHGALVS